MSPEELADTVIAKHGLKHIHFFFEGKTWRAFGARTNTKGWQESVADGSGSTIAESIDALDRRLDAGPIRGRNLPF